MFNSKIPWKEKLERVKDHKIVNVPPRMQARFGKGTMLIPKPLDLDSLIKKVSKGKLVTQTGLRDRLSKDFKTDSTCPITTGIFLRIISEASEEAASKGLKSVTPYWRVISNKGALNDKFPGGASAQAKKLASEGHKITKTKNGKGFIVDDFEKKLVNL